MTHVQQWRQQFDKLESVDLRYDGQIIVNPDLEGMARQPALTPAAAKAAMAAGVKTAAIVNYEKYVTRPAPRPLPAKKEAKAESESREPRRHAAQPLPQPRASRGETRIRRSADQPQLSNSSAVQIDCGEAALSAVSRRPDAGRGRTAPVAVRRKERARTAAIRRFFHPRAAAAEQKKPSPSIPRSLRRTSDQIICRITQPNFITAIDVGSAKTSVLVAELSDNGLRYRGHGISESRGLRKGVITELDKAVGSIQKAVEQPRTLPVSRSSMR